MAGRPLKYKNKKELETAIEKYFAGCDKTGEPYTMAGLAYSLGIDRKTLLNYSKENQFFPTIKKARSRIEAFNEGQLYTNNHTAGIIFNLKNNFGWSDKQDVNVHQTEDVVAEKLTEVFGFRAKQETD